MIGLHDDTVRIEAPWRADVHTANGNIVSQENVRCGISAPFAPGLGRVKTQACVASVEDLEGIAHRESQIMLRI